MAAVLGHRGRLFVLAFDHRGSLARRLGVDGDATEAQLARLRDVKALVYEGFKRLADDPPVPVTELAVLVDEEYGAEVARAARDADLTLAMPAERSGQDVFDLAYGSEFARHIEDFEPDLVKVLVRWNPGDDPVVKRTQADRLSHLGSWLHETGRRLLFELLVPASDEDLARVDGDVARYDREVRPGSMRRAVRELHELGVEPDVWKIEGLDDREDCASIAALIRADGRDEVIAVVLGRGADEDTVHHWLRQAAPVEGYQGFAIGRSIWSAPVDGFLTGEVERDQAAARIADAYRRCIEVYTAAEAA